MEIILAPFLAFVALVTYWFSVATVYILIGIAGAALFGIIAVRLLIWAVELFSRLDGEWKISFLTLVGIGGILVWG